MMMSEYYDDYDLYEGYVAEDCAEELMREAFTRGLLCMREHLVRFIEQYNKPGIAESARLQWSPAWGEDPKTPPTDEDGSSWLKDVIDGMGPKVDP